MSMGHCHWLVMGKYCPSNMVIYICFEKKPTINTLQLDTQYAVYMWTVRPDVDLCDIVLVRVVSAGHSVRGVRVEWLVAHADEGRGERQDWLSGGSLQHRQEVYSRDNHTLLQRYDMCLCGQSLVTREKLCCFGVFCKEQEFVL